MPDYVAGLRFSEFPNSEQREEIRILMSKMQLDINSLSRANDRYRTFKDSRKSIILVEVQKGADQYIEQACLQGAKPVVEVSLQPSGEELDTFAGQPVIPLWFAFFSLDVLPTSKSVCFKVVCDRNIGGRFEYGHIEFPLSELMDGKIKDDWFPLVLASSAKPGESPRLKLRFQYVDDLSRLMETYSQLSEQAIAKIAAVYNRMKDALEATVY
jgi:hypothetical protein